MLLISAFGGLLHASAPAHGAQWPAGLSFTARTAEIWQLYVVPSQGESPRIVPTVSEPRTPAFDLRSGRVAYIGADGNLYEHGLDAPDVSPVLTVSADVAYTQPAYASNAARLYLVALKQGASVDTDILVLDETRKVLTPVVTQRSAQFDPVAAGAHSLFYSSVSCTVSCGKIIQDIWQMNVLSGEADQVTMRNSIARQPALSADGTWLYFSSNLKGNFHIWRQRRSSGAYEQLTRGQVTDVFPQLDARGELYFIRRTPAGVQLMHQSGDGSPAPVPLPPGVLDVRDLRIGL